MAANRFAMVIGIEQVGARNTGWRLLQ